MLDKSPVWKCVSVKILTMHLINLFWYFPTSESGKEISDTSSKGYCMKSTHVKALDSTGVGMQSLHFKHKYKATRANLYLTKGFGKCLSLQCYIVCTIHHNVTVFIICNKMEDWINHIKNKCGKVMHMKEISVPLNKVLSCSQAINASSLWKREKLCSELSVNRFGLGNCSPLQVESWAKVELDWNLTG